MFIVKNRIIFYILSFFLIASSIFAVAKWGLNMSIDFKGGSAIEIQPNALSTTTVVTGIQAKEILQQAFPESTVRAYGEKGFLINTVELTGDQQGELRARIARVLPSYEISRFDNVGPILGEELKKKSIGAIIAVLIAIVLFITFAFRQVSKPVSSFKYGLAAIVSLAHDVIIPIGFFAFMGHFVGGYEIDALFVTALLVVLGFSIHDTIVVFDRVRENLHLDKNKSATFEHIVGESVSETFIRSINTSLTTIFALVAVYVWGPEATHNFSLALIVGIAAGTYSSIFVGSPLLVTMAGKLGGKKR